MWESGDFLVSYQDESWTRALDGFCARTGRPSFLYTVERLQGRTNYEEELERYEIQAMRRRELQELASMHRVPYWAEMRIDELRAVMMKIGGALSDG